MHGKQESVVSWIDALVNGLKVRVGRWSVSDSRQESV